MGNPAFLLGVGIGLVSQFIQAYFPAQTWITPVGLLVGFAFIAWGITLWRRQHRVPVFQLAGQAIPPIPRSLLAGDTIEASLRKACERVEAYFSLPRGLPKPGEVTQAITVKVGEPRDFLATQPADTVWAAVEVLVAFETRQHKSVRPIFTSYVMIGRIAPGRNVVGICDDSRRWRVIVEGASSDPSHYDVMVEAVERERLRLLAKLEPAIR